MSADSVQNSLPTRARVVVIGGGVVGASVAYHLTKLGFTDLVLLEQGQLSSGTTWHAAGLVGQLRSSASITQVLKYSVDLYKKLEAETGLQTGWKMTGCLRLATNQDRWTEFKRLATTATEVLVTLRRPGDTQVVMTAYHVPAASHEDSPPLDVLAYILGDTPSGRLYKALVYDRQIAQSVSAQQQSMMLTSVFQVEALARPGHTADELAAVYHEVVSMGEHKKSIGDNDIRRMVERVRGGQSAAAAH